MLKEVLGRINNLFQRNGRKPDLPPPAQVLVQPEGNFSLSRFIVNGAPLLSGEHQKKDSRTIPIGKFGTQKVTYQEVEDQYLERKFAGKDALISFRYRGENDHLEVILQAPNNRDRSILTWTPHDQNPLTRMAIKMPPGFQGKRDNPDVMITNLYDWAKFQHYPQLTRLIAETYIVISPATNEITLNNLDAGDPLVVKYTNGQPF